MRRFCFTLGMSLALFARPSPAGTTVHVSPQGNDGASGTAAAPIRTVKHLAGLLKSRKDLTEVVFHEGIYRGSFHVPQGPGKAHLLMRAAKGEKVIFDGANPLTGAGPVKGTSGVFVVKNALNYRSQSYQKQGLYPHMWDAKARKRYMLVADLRAVRAFPGTFCFTGDALYIHTVDDRPPAEHAIEVSMLNVGKHGVEISRSNMTLRGIRVRNFFKDDNWTAGIAVRGNNVTVEDCRAFNCPRGFRSYGQQIRFLRCRSDDCGSGVWVKSPHVTVENGRFFKIRDAFMILMAPQEDTGIEVYYSAGKRGEFRGNLCKGFNMGIFFKCKPGVFIVENNTFVDCNIGIHCRPYIAPTLYCRRNLIYGCGQPFGHQKIKVVEGNLIYPAPWREAKSIQGELDFINRLGSGNLLADPLLGAPYANEFRLRPGSPCLPQKDGDPGIGAFGVLPDDFTDTHPPVVKLNDQPGLTRVTDVSGRLPVYRSAQSACRITVRAFDTGGTVARIKTRVGDGAWSQPAHYDPNQGPVVSLPKDGEPVEISVQVADALNNWSQPASILLQRSTGIPAPAVHTADRSPRVWYVSPDGMDTRGHGSAEKPVRTIQFAADRAIAGDRIVLKSGLYTGETRITRGGTQEAPLEITAEVPGTVVLDGRRRVRTLIALVEAPYVVITGLELRWYGNPTRGAAISIDRSPHVTVRRCKIWNAFWKKGRQQGTGIYVVNSPGFTAERNLLFKNDGSMKLRNSPNSRIVYNTAISTSHFGINFDRSAAGSVLRNNDLSAGGNDVYAVYVANAKEMASFDADYNNLGTRLRGWRNEPGVVPNLRIGGSKAVVRFGDRSKGKSYKRLRTFEDWQKFSGKDKHSIFADPKRKNPALLQLEIDPKSPNIGAGENGTTIGAMGVWKPRPSGGASARTGSGPWDGALQNESPPRPARKHEARARLSLLRPAAGRPAPAQAHLARNVTVSTSVVAKLREAIVAGVRSGRRETVYIELAGRLLRGQLVDADAAGIQVKASGVEVPVAWTSLAPRRFHAIARKFDAAPAILAAYRRGTGLTDSP